MTDVTGDQRGEGPLRVLLLYYSYTGQSRRVLEAAGEVLRERGCEVHKAEIEFTDPRFSRRFSRFPMRHVWPDMLSVLPAQKRRATGRDPNPGYRAQWRLRPDLHRLTDVVADREHADALLPEVGRSAKAISWASLLLCSSFAVNIGAKTWRRCASSPSGRAVGTSTGSISRIPVTRFAPCCR